MILVVGTLNLQHLLLQGQELSRFSRVKKVAYQMPHFILGKAFEWRFLLPDPSMAGDLFIPL